MVLDNIAPPVSNLNEMWNIFEFNLSIAFGWTPLIGFALIALSAWLVLRAGRGDSSKDAIILILAMIPVLASLGFLPDWVKLILYIIVTLIVRWLYDQG